MSASTPIDLRIWENDFGVASVDPDSLTLLTLFKMYRVDMTVTYATIPQWQNIPSLHYNNSTISNRNEVFIQAMIICKADAMLDVVQSSQIIVYKSYFRECFVEAFNIDCWIVEYNYEHAIKTWYSNAMPFPFNYLYLKKRREEAFELFDHMRGPCDQNKFISRCFDKASRCLEDFDDMLRDRRQYILGDNPTSLDAYVYSYLVICLNMPLPNPALQNIINKFSYLTRYVRNMSIKYYPDLQTKMKYVEPVNATDERASTKSLILAAVFASSAMLIFAYVNGIIKPRIPSISR